MNNNTIIVNTRSYNEFNMKYLTNSIYLNNYDIKLIILIS